MSKNLEKSFLVLTSTSEDIKSFTCAVKNTGVDISGTTSYHSFGSTMYFKPKDISTRQSGGLAFFTSSNGGDGYFIRIKTSQTAGLFGDEVRILKVSGGNIIKVFDGGYTSSQKDIIAIQEGKYYKIDVFVKATGSTVEINAYINGNLITATDDSSILTKTSNVALFANLGSAFFDYIYAIKISESNFKNRNIFDIYNSQIGAQMATLAYGEFFINGIGTVNSATNEKYVEEFGSVAREIRYIKKRYDSVPSIPRFVYANLNSSVKVLGSRIMPFEAELYLINNSGATTLVNSSLGTQINVVGNNIIKNSGIVYEETITNKYFSQEPIVFESAWLQGVADAISLSDFIKLQWSKSNTMVKLSVFGNPILSVYDVITISHAFSEIDPNQKFIITNISQSWGEGLETTIIARSIVV